MATATWTVWTTGSSIAASASFERLRKAAGGVLTAKQAPRRPGTTPALGLRAEERATRHDAREGGRYTRAAMHPALTAAVVVGAGRAALALRAGMASGPRRA